MVHKESGHHDVERLVDGRKTLRVALAQVGLLLFIVKESATAIWRRMMDTVEQGIVDGIEDADARVPGVEGVESVRVRWIGHRMHSEVSLRVGPDPSVAEAYRIRDGSFENARRSVPKLSRLTDETLPAQPQPKR